jgi:PqqD family protein of HPr-rel-A system
VEAIRATSRAVLVRTWDDRSVVYDCASGDTLFLEELPSVVYALVCAEPLDEGAIVERLVTTYEDEPEALRAGVRQAVDELDKLGLVSQPSRSGA